MNKRQKKKYIPKDTEYCYELIEVFISNEGMKLHTKKCPNYKIIGYIDDAIVDSQGNEHFCKSPIAYCSYSKVSSEEDSLLLNQCKTCGERLPKYDY